MKHFYIDSKTLLGGIVYSNENQEIVHLSLLAGNTVPRYQIDAELDIFVIEGKVEFTKEQLSGREEVLILKARELIVLPANQSHHMKAIEDSQILVVKVK